MFARLSLALAGSTLLLASPALAQAEPVSINVAYADLDLASDAGRAQLDRRVRKAANQACETGALGIDARTAFQTCRSEARAAAGRDVARLAQLKDGNLRLAQNAR